MNDKDILDFLSTEFPVGLGGCRSTGISFDSCEYNVTIFDEKNLNDEILKHNDYVIKVSHGSLKNLDSDVLINYDHMRILSDASWELQMFLSKIQEKRLSIFLDYAKNCILNSIFCCTKAKNGIDSDIFAPCWQKSASIFLANSILSINHQSPTPSHSLEKLRNFTKNNINDKISIVNDTLGIERATSSSLTRMCKSTIGFSEHVENNNHSLIIQSKYDYFINNSMLADCYFYLTCINHENFISLKNSIHRNPDLIYILKTAFDLENDPEKLRHDIEIIHKACDDILANLHTN